ncbi:MAG: phage tail protein I [Rhodospirillaceae bacterium]|nr:phage tail protein I [Rhodospirillales bacterium]
MANLLPPASSPLEHAIANTCAVMADVDVSIATLWDPAKCPAPLLPWLAWALSVDTWDSNWPEPTKRQVIAASVEIHRRKGTVASVKRAIEAALGQTPQIVEGLHRPRRDGTCTRNGHYYRGWSAAWALYRVILTRPVRNDQADAVRAILDETAPARSHLASMDYSKVAILRDGQACRDGAYNRGIYT